MPLTPLKTTLVSGMIAACATTATADTVSDLAALSKSDFLEEYALRFTQSIVLQRELLNRVSEGLGDDALSDDPITETEFAAFECTYDYMAERDQLVSLAKQITSLDRISEMAKEDPAFSYVNMIFEDDVIEEMADAVPEVAMDAMSECGQMTASRDRLNFTPEFWAKVGAAAEAQGLNE